ncbi:MAG: RNA polymerase sigma factor [Rhodoluna sp.]
MTQPFGSNEAAIQELVAQSDWLRLRCRQTNIKWNEELFSRVMEKALNGIHNYADHGHGMKPWLNRILHNVHVDMLRENSTETANTTANTQVHSDGEEVDLLQLALDEALQTISAEDQFMFLNDSSRIGVALSKLDDEFRETLRLSLMNYSYKEIAEKLNIPVNTVGSRIHRAKKDIRKHLKELAGEYGIPTKTKKK